MKIDSYNYLKAKLPDKLKYYENEIQKVEMKIAETSPGSIYDVFSYAAWAAIALDDIPNAKKLFNRAIMALQNAEEPIIQFAPRLYRLPDNFPWHLYLGMGPKKSKEHFRLIFSETEPYIAQMINIPGASEVYQAKTRLCLIAYILGNTEKIGFHMKYLNEKSKKCQNIKLQSITSQKISSSKIDCLYCRAGIQIVNGMLFDSQEDVKRGILIWSELMNKLLCKTDRPMAIANLFLTVAFDQAKSKWQDFYVDSRYIPLSVKKNGYWTKEEIERMNKES